MERLRVVESLAGVPAAQWNSLVAGGPEGAGNPFVSHEFLSALIETGCACARTGWRPQILLLEKNDVLAGAMPMFLKSHSRGEYVFEVAPDSSDQIARLREQIDTAGVGLCGLLHFWSLDAPPSDAMTTSELMEFQRVSCESVLSVFQAFEKSGRKVPDLWLITAGAQPLDEKVEALNVSQAPLWGLGRVLLNEQRNVRSRLVDLSAACTAVEIESVLNELRGDDFEEEVACTSTGPPLVLSVPAARYASVVRLIFDVALVAASATPVERPTLRANAVDVLMS